MDLLFYKTLHVSSVMLLFVALGATIAGGNPRFAKTAGMLHGIALVLLLVSGMGLLAKLQIMGTTKFWIAKLVIWLLLGVSLVVAKRKLLHAPALTIIVLVLGTISAYLGIYKPF